MTRKPNKVIDDDDDIYSPSGSDADDSDEEDIYNNEEEEDDDEDDVSSVNSINSVQSEGNSADGDEGEEKNYEIVEDNDEYPSWAITEDKLEVGEEDDEEVDSEDDSEDDNDDQQDTTNEKITEDMRQTILDKYHPELNAVSQEEIFEMCQVTRDKDNIIIDENHKTLPILTKYEKTKILGIRAKQINNGAPSFISMDYIPGAQSRKNIIDSTESQVQKLQEKHFDGYLVALEELKQKVIPVIIRRPLPDGRSEYWPLKELEVFM